MTRVVGPVRPRSCLWWTERPHPLCGYVSKGVMKKAEIRGEDIPLIKGIDIYTLVGEMVKQDRIVVAVVTEAMHKQHACLGCISRHLPRLCVQLDAIVRLVCALERCI